MTRPPLLIGAVLAGMALLPGGPVAAQSARETVAADVLTRPIQRGDVVSESDFAEQDISAVQARGVVSAAEAAGLEARRNLRSGMPVRATDLTAPRLVRRGEPVTITLRSGALLITATGRALGDAALGQPVRVFSEATNQTLSGVVESAGRVRVIAG